MAMANFSSTLVAAIWGVTAVTTIKAETQPPRLKSPDDTAAVELVKSALAVRDPAKVDARIRRGSATPEQVVAFLAGLEKTDEKTAIDKGMAKFGWIGSIDHNGMSQEGVEVTFRRDGERNRRLAILTPDENGVWKMDFAAFARRAEPSWEELLDKEGKSGVVRVIVAKDHYYNGPFQDDKVWQSYGIAAVDREELLLGYCKIDSPQYRALESILANESGPTFRVTLGLRRVKDGARRQFEITQVIAEDWVVGPKMFDEAFK